MGGRGLQSLCQPLLLPLPSLPTSQLTSCPGVGREEAFGTCAQPLPSFLGLVTQEPGPTLSGPEAEVTHPTALAFTHHTPIARGPGWSKPYSPHRQGHAKDTVNWAAGGTSKNTTSLRTFQLSHIPRCLGKQEANPNTHGPPLPS